MLDNGSRSAARHARAMLCEPHTSAREPARRHARQPDVCRVHPREKHAPVTDTRPPLLATTSPRRIARRSGRPRTTCTPLQAAPAPVPPSLSPGERYSPARCRPSTSAAAFGAVTKTRISTSTSGGARSRAAASVRVTQSKRPVPTRAGHRHQLARAPGDLGPSRDSGTANRGGTHRRRGSTRRRAACGSGSRRAARARERRGAWAACRPRRSRPRRARPRRPRRGWGARRTGRRRAAAPARQIGRAHV